MLTTDLFDLKFTIAAELLRRHIHPWSTISELSDFIIVLGHTLNTDMFNHPAENIWIAKSASVSPTAFINGPLIIDEGAELRHCAFVRSSAIIGKNAVVGNSTELKNCILFDGVQVPHFNYIGDSILGHCAHMGAGAVTSNVRSDKRTVVIHYEQNIETGLQKLGAMLGDFSEVGCNSVLNPGTILGKNTIVYPTSCVRGVLEDNHIWKNDGQIVQRR